MPKHTRGPDQTREATSALLPLPTASTLATTPRVLPARKGAGGARSGSPKQSAWALQTLSRNPESLSLDLRDDLEITGIKTRGWNFNQRERRGAHQLCGQPEQP